MLEHDYRVCFEIAHVDGLASLNRERVSLAHEPADVRVKEAVVGIMGVGISVRVLVVSSVVPNPLVYRGLEAHCLKVGQQ